MNQNKIELLKKFNMTNNEAEVYITLAKFGTLTVKEIKERTKVPRNKIYEALENLEKKSRITTLEYKPKKFQIINPEFLKKEANEFQSFTNELINTIKTTNQKDESKFFEIIKSKKTLIEKLAIQNLKTKTEIIGANKFSNKLYKNIKHFKLAIKKGVKIKIITTFQEDKIENYKLNLNTGMEIRIYDEKKFGTPLQRMTVFDKKIARFTIAEPEIINNEDIITIWSESKILANAFQLYLENLWKNCKPIENYLKKYK